MFIKVIDIIRCYIYNYFYKYILEILENRGINYIVLYDLKI